jgi:hypothetical protein
LTHPIGLLRFGHRIAQPAQPAQPREPLRHCKMSQASSDVSCYSYDSWLRILHEGCRPICHLFPVKTSRPAGIAKQGAECVTFVMQRSGENCHLGPIRAGAGQTTGSVIFGLSDFPVSGSACQSPQMVSDEAS